MDNNTFEINENETNELFELLLLRDSLKRKAESIKRSYTARFGELHEQIMELGIDILGKKQALSYCRSALNRSLEPDYKELEALLAQNYESRIKSLLELRKERLSLVPAPAVSPLQHEKAQKLFKKIAKLIHPDLHPELAGRCDDVWIDACSAAEKDDVLWLEELYLLAGTVSGNSDLIPASPEKLESVKEQITRIRTSKPYTLRRFLDDPEETQLHEDALKHEIEEKRRYSDYLTRELRSLLAGRDLPWEMN